MAALSLVVGLTASLFIFAFGAAAIFAAVYCYYHKAPSFVPRRKQRSGRLGPDTSASADLEKGGGASAAGAAGFGPPMGSAKVCDEDGVRRYGWSEIRRLTGDFTSAVVGQGGFSTVYVAQLPGGSGSAVAAVKVHRERTDRLRMAFRQELDVLMRVGRHDRIVRLLGYCDVGDEGEGEGAGEDEEEGGGAGGVKAAGALVLEYVPNGTLHEALHGVVGEGQQVLDWGTRMCVAYELASALEYLHECCDPQVVHCDIKPSNVLLDEQGSCKLCDFGSAKTGFSSTVGPPPPSTQQQQHQYLMPLPLPPSLVPHPSSTAPSPTHKDNHDSDNNYYHQRRRHQTRPLLGSPGYVDPYYLRTGVASKKSDVYSFGVVVLELLTGTEAFCPSTERMLTPMVRPVLKQLAETDTAGERPTATATATADLVRELVDKRLGAGEYDPAEATAMAGLALGCLREQPSMRPSMTDVLNTMREMVPSAFSAHEQNRDSRKFNSK